MDISVNSGDIDTKITTETIENIEFNRAKDWSNVINQLHSITEEETLKLSDLDESYVNRGKDIDENSDSEHMAEEIDILEEEDLAQNITNRLNITFAKNTSNLDAHILLSQIENSVNISTKPDIKEMLEETLPLIENHKRNLRETGLERTLNTFDIDKIDKKVGEWKRHINTTRSKNISPILENVTRAYFRNQEQRNIGSENETDSDSLHSIDTARYILSSKKHVGLQKRYASKKTSIKCYRLVESKRNELHKKYAHLGHDDSEKLINDARCSYKIQSTPELRALGCTHGHGIKKRYITSENHHVRKKLYRRHRDDLYSYSTSDEEDMVVKHSKSLKSNSGLRGGLCCSGSQRMSLFSLSSHYNCTPCCSATQNQKFYQNCRKRSGNCLYVRESECACRESNRLCSFVRHLANSSSEDWLVENCYSSEDIIPHREELKSHKKLKRLFVDEYGHSLQVNKETEKQKKKMDIKRNTQNDNKIEKRIKNISNTKNNFPDNEVLKQQKAIKNEVSLTRWTTEHKVEVISSSDEELKKYEKVLKENTHQDTKTKPKIKSQKKKNKTQYFESSDDSTILEDTHQDTKTKPKIKSQKKKNETQYVESSDGSTFLEELNTAIKKSKIEFENERRKRELKETQTQSTRSINFENNSDTRQLQHTKTPSIRLRPGLSESESETHTVCQSKTSVLKKDRSKSTKVQNHIENRRTKKSAIKLSSNSDTDKNSSFTLENKSKRKTNFAASKLPKIPEDVPTQSNTKSETSNRINKKCITNSTHKEDFTQNNLDMLVESDKKINATKETIELNNYERNSSPVSSINSVKSNAIYTGSASSENTFFANAGAIYNSTALANNSATSRQVFLTNISSQNLTINAETNLQKRKTIKVPLTKKRSPPADVVSTTNNCAKLEKREKTNPKTHTTEKDNGHSFVTSTTDSGFSQATTTGNNVGNLSEKASTLDKNQKRILLYNPKEPNFESSQYIHNGRFKLTKHHLEKCIGYKSANIFMKYYTGPLEFKSTSTLYYNPPEFPFSDDSSDSGDDILELYSRYGDLHEVQK